MRIFIYSRKSVYTGKGDSIENQVEMCRQYITSRIDGGKDAAITVYEDEGFSGKNLDRPQFQRMLADSNKQKPDYIVCYRLDRISRSVGDFAPLVENLITRDIGFICIKEQFDTSTPMGKAMMYIASVFAQLERETIAERVRDNMLMLARTGRWLGGPPPTGFASEKVEEVVVNGKVKTSYKLKADPAEIGTVKLMFQKYQELRSLNGVSKHLIHAGVRNRSSEAYSLPGIRDILRNPVYCTADFTAREYFIRCGSDVCFPPEQCSDAHGLLSYNKRNYSQKGHSRLDKSQWIIAIGKHRGLISGADWVRVQQLLEENAENAPQKPPQSYNDYSLLSGQIFCSKCGARMFAKRRSNSDCLFDYICGSKLQAGALCNCQNLNGRQADDLVCNYLLDYAREDDGIHQLLEVLKKKIESQTAEPQVECFDMQIEKASRELDGLIAALAAGNGSESVIHHVNTRMEALDQELKRLTAAKAQAQKMHNGTELESTKIAALSWSLASFQHNFPDMTIHEKRDFVRLFVQKLEWNGKDLHIFVYEG